MKDLDVLIIGGGQAGIPLAWALAGKGMHVGLAERKQLGGSCVNFGCTPTKAAIASARLAHLANRGREFGIEISSVRVDFAAVLKRAASIAAESRHGLEKNLRTSDNPRWLHGHAQFVGRDSAGFKLHVDSDELIAKQVVLDTGTRTLIPPIPGLDKIDFIDAGNWLSHTELPSHLAIIGGSYIGLEMGQFYSRMGSKVTIWETSPRIIPREDEDVSSALQAFLAREGIQFHLGQKIETDEALGTREVFVATGRKPNTDDLGLDTVGVDVDRHGFVKVNEKLQTNVHGIWAAGDIRGGPMFTHTSWDDYRILESQIIGDGSRTTDRIVPYAVFTDPELGRVGLTEREASEQRLNFRVQRFEMNKNGKAREIGEPEGFIKVLIEEPTGKILGAALLCHEAAELVHMYVDVMNAKAPSTVIRDAVYIHPTLAEAVQSAVK